MVDTAGGAPYTIRPHRPEDLPVVVAREGALYREEFGWSDEFEALVARIVAEFAETFDPTRERCWIAEIGGRHAGHIFLVKHPERAGVAKLRLLMVEREARGLGLGHALVHECLAFARATGYRTVTLWTQSLLHSAHRIYEAAGFTLVAEQPHHSFGHDLIAQTWELELA